MSIILDGTSGITSPNETVTGQFSSGSTFGFKNRIINGGMVVSQRGTSATVTAGTTVPTSSTGYPVVDRFFVYSTGANVTAAQVAGSGAIQKRLQITGAAAVTAIGIGQRIEQQNSYDLAGSTATLSVDISNSLLTAVTWTASYATTTADTFGTIGTPTKTQIATGTFTVTSTVTNYNAQISIPVAATTGIEILLTVGAQTSGTWIVGNVQLEKGSVATSFDQRAYSQELAMCQRYYVGANTYYFTVGYDTNYTTFNSGGLAWDYQMRVTPTISIGSGGMDGHHGTAPTVRSGPVYNGVSFQFSGSALRTNANCSAFVAFSLMAEL